MVDVLSRVNRSVVMSRIRSCGNKSTEDALAKLFRRNKIDGWRRQIEIISKNPEAKVFKVRPDFAFQKLKLAVFVDGCFWHACPRHATKPKSNCSFWNQKLSANKKRDVLVNRQLRKLGWRVIRIWECALKKNPLNCLRQIQRALKD